MKKIKYCILGLSLMAVGFMAGGCADSAYAGKDNFTFLKTGTSTYIDSYVLIDSETGVNYIVVSGSNSKSITPRLTTDGNIYLSKEEK